MEQHIAVTMSDGAVYLYAMQLTMRAPSRPLGPDWNYDDAHGEWFRPASPAAIEFDIMRAESGLWSKPGKLRDGTILPGVFVLSHRMISPAELALFEQRDYRDALVDNGGRIEHDMTMARERHRKVLRHVRSEKLAELDAQFSRALGQGRKPEQDAVEAQRQRLRDITADPRIDAAQTLDQLRQVTI